MKKYKIDINRESILFSCMFVVAFILAYLLNEYDYEGVRRHIMLFGCPITIFMGNLPLVAHVDRDILVLTAFFIVLISYIIVRAMMLFSNNNLLPPEERNKYKDKFKV